MDAASYTRALLAASLALILSCLVEQGTALECYFCSPALTRNGSALCEAFGGLTKDQRAIYKMSCDPKYTMCRKSYQEVQEVVRVMYSCAELGKVGCKKSAGTYKIKSVTCQCDTDLCNKGPKSALGIASPITVIASSLFVVITALMLTHS